MNTKLATAALTSATGLLLSFSAFAGGYCSETTPCKLASDVCNGNYCVPKTKICSNDAGCQGWEKCDFSCPGGVGGGSVGSSGSGGTGVASSDAGSSEAMPSSDASSGKGGSADAGGSSDQAQIDAAGSADANGFAQPDAVKVEPPKSNCPKDKGVCVAQYGKLPVQPGCDAFCAAVVGCDLNSQNQTEPGQPPPAQADGGTSVPPSEGDASGAKKAPDTWSADGGGEGGPDNPDAMGEPGDANIQPPNKDKQVAECVQMCSLWKLEKAGVPQLDALAVCAEKYKNQCADLQKECQKPLDELQKALFSAGDDSWSLGMGGIATSMEGSNSGGTKGGDNADAVGAGAPRQSSDAGSLGDGGGAAASSNGSQASSGGCTAATAIGTSTSGLLMLFLVLSGAIVLRRKMI